MSAIDHRLSTTLELEREHGRAVREMIDMNNESKVTNYFESPEWWALDEHIISITQDMKVRPTYKEVENILNTQFNTVMHELKEDLQN